MPIMAEYSNATAVKHQLGVGQSTSITTRHYLWPQMGQEKERWRGGECVTPDVSALTSCLSDAPSEWRSSPAFYMAHDFSV